jgi:hypothetical protein
MRTFLCALIRSFHLRGSQPLNPTRDFRKSPFSVLDTRIVALNGRIESYL